MGLVRQADSKLIDWLDTLTTKIQKKGLLPLNTLIMGTECLFLAGWAGQLFNYIYLWPLYFFVAMGIYFAYSRWKDAIGYWENQRKMLSLNAMVLLHREAITIRLVTLSFFIPLLLINIILIFDLPTVIASVAIMVLRYLECCKYIGPGEYAREKQQKLLGLPEAG